jgi:hypothetical protein
MRSRFSDKDISQARIGSLRTREEIGRFSTGRRRDAVGAQRHLDKERQPNTKGEFKCGSLRTSESTDSCL